MTKIMLSPADHHHILQSARHDQTFGRIKYPFDRFHDRR